MYPPKVCICKCNPKISEEVIIIHVFYIVLQIKNFTVNELDVFNLWVPVFAKYVILD